FVADVTGGEDGVEVETNDGDISVTITGTATGEGNDGVDVEAQYGNIAVFAQAVSGADEGIEAQVAIGSSATISIFSSGAVTGGDTGVQTRAGYGATYIFANDVSGGDYGVEARSYAGDIVIDLAGDVTASSGTAIFAETYGDGYVRTEYFGPGDIRSYGGNSITVRGDVVGSVNGVEFVKNQYTYGALNADGPAAAPGGGEVTGGYVDITIEGSVRGGSGAGVLVRQVDNGPGALDPYGYRDPLFAVIDVYGDVSAESGVAIDARTVETGISIFENANVTGDILLGDYGDSVSLNSATLTADTRIFAGENPEATGGEPIFARRFSEDFLSVSGDTSVVASNLYGFNQLYIGEYATLRVADDDVITLEESNFGRIRLLGAGDGPQSMGRRAFRGGDLTIYGGELITGTNLTVNVGQSVVIGNSYDSEFDAATSTTIETFRSVGQLTIGGTPGRSRVEFNFDAPDDYAGLYNAGRINMANGAAGDQIIVNAEFATIGDIDIDISPNVGADAIIARGDVFAVGVIDVNVVDATTLGRTEHVVISSTNGVVTEGRFIDEEGGDPEAPGAIEPGGEVGDIPETLTAVTDSVVADVDLSVEETEVIVGVQV
ncbi:MAG: hypothetical protein AAFU55_09460, partial [Pseudomonadota bacterium]